jgi:GNAT superfamily N-acetyltransferase
VAEKSDHRIVGCLTATIQARRCPDGDYRRVGAIGGAFVEKRYRKKGIGGQLVEAAAQFFSRRRVKHITVRNVVFNELANRFWEQLSFRPVIHTRTTNLHALTKALQRRKH